eukprot:TRINITY_DN1553_c0_g1_i1.p1 TRINITY_DN1553_c0_g1~~TRINITY_DN1553_c0_g1_i1.p1  ORF type:complete len:575 (+),score=124.98 TRINITY_DN1553_c0_g1_i1:2916-4640(+)
MSEQKADSLEEHLSISDNDNFKAELEALSRQIESQEKAHEEQKQELIQKYESQIESTKTEIADRLQKLFEKKASRLQPTEEDTSRKNAEEAIRKQLEAKYAFRLREEKSRMCIELKAKIESELKREAAKKLAETETDVRQRIIHELEEGIKRDLEAKKQKVFQKEAAKINQEYRTQVEEYVRKHKEEEFKARISEKIDELQKDAARRIDDYSTKIKEDVQSRLQSHITELNSRQNERLEKERDKMSIICKKELEKEAEKRKLTMVLDQFKEHLGKNLRDQLKTQLEPVIRAELEQKAKDEIIEKNKNDLNKQIVTLKRKSKPKLEQKLEDIKRKCTEFHNTSVKEKVSTEENIIRSNVRQDFEIDRREAQISIDEVYEEKYQNELDKIEQTRNDIKRMHSTLLANIRKLQTERKAINEEYEAKDFDLTKQEIEVRNQLESVEIAKERSLLKCERSSVIKKQPSVVNTVDFMKSAHQKGTSLFIRRDPSKETFLNYSSQNVKTRGETEFAEGLSRILPNPDELVDKAINDIGFEDIIAKVMNKSEIKDEPNSMGGTKEEGFLIPSQHEIDEITDY